MRVDANRLVGASMMTGVGATVSFKSRDRQKTLVCTGFLKIPENIALDP
ncbi:MAG: hypothetical protein ACE5GQ_03080 [Nitrospinales bacterium]